MLVVRELVPMPAAMLAKGTGMGGKGRQARASAMLAKPLPLGMVAAWVGRGVRRAGVVGWVVLEVREGSWGLRREPACVCVVGEALNQYP